MNDSNLSPVERATRAVARARAQSAGADEQGRPLGHRVYTYDQAGCLVSVAEAEPKANG